MSLEITDSNFDQQVLKSELPVLVDFWAQWCGPCVAMSPVIEELSKEYEGKAIIGKMDVDNNPNISLEFGIRNIPTLLIFKNGVIADKIVGAVPKSVLKSKLEGALAPA